MPESNLPSGTADGGALSFDDGVSAIENLDIGSETKPEDQVEATNEAETPDESQEDELVIEAETDDTDDAEDEDGPDEVGKGGKFVSNDAKVTLSDGTVTTVEVLKRGFMSQQSFTRSTQEVAEKRKSLEAKESEIGQTAQALSQQRDFLLRAAPLFLPKAPDKAMLDPASGQYDPIGYTHAMHEYTERMQVINQLQYQSQAEKARNEEEQSKTVAERRAEEAQKLFDAVPEFRDRKVYDQFWTDATKLMAEEYGFSPEEMAETVDHRMYKAMRDLVKYQKALQRAKTVNKDIRQKPQLIKGGKRMDPKAKISREAQARSENLRKSGSFDAGVAALMDLDL